MKWIRSGDLHPAPGLTKTVNRCLFLTGQQQTETGAMAGSCTLTLGLEDRHAVC